MTLAVALAYVLALKLIFAPVPFGLPSFDGVILGKVICHSGGDGSQNPSDTGQHQGCDDCCLIRIAALVTPLLLVALIIYRAPAPIIVRVFRFAMVSAGPPIEAWSRVRAQRAPPLPLFA